MANTKAVFLQNGLRVIYFDENGIRAIRSLGKRPWRNNNPGNLRYTDTTKGYGAIGEDDNGFAIFPDKDTGDLAQRLLFKEHYGDNSIYDGMLKYDPELKGSEDEKKNEIARKKRENYVSVLKQEGKVDLKRSFGSLNDKELTDMQDAFQRAEGFWKPDRINTERAPMPSDLSRHLPKDKSFKTNRIVISGEESRHRPEDNPYGTLSFGDLEQFETLDVEQPAPVSAPPNLPAQPVGDSLELPASDDLDEYF